MTIPRFSRPRPRLLVLIFSTFFGLMAAWGVADWVRSRHPSPNQSPYALSFVDQAGRPISGLDGPLRLVLDPFLGRPFEESAPILSRALGSRGALR